MENYLLYEDEDKRVEIDGMVHYYIDQIMIPYIKLPTSFIEKFIPMTIDRLIKEGFDLDGKEIQYWISAPIFQPNRYACFSRPFNIFEEAQHYIVETFHLGDNYVELEDDLIELYDGIIEPGDTFIPIVFSEKIADILGCFIYVNDKKIVVMFWSFVEGGDND